MVKSRLNLSVVACIAFVASLTRAPAKDVQLSEPELPTIDISRLVAGEKRQITLEDMVSIREVREPRQSPDGRQVAFLVRQAFRSCDCYRVALYVTAAEGQGAPKKLTEDAYLANVQWSPDGRRISYLSSKNGSVQLWWVDTSTLRADRMLARIANLDVTVAHVLGQSRYIPPAGVLDYRWSPDGRHIAFTTEPPADPALSVNAIKEGFRYDDTTMTSWNLILGDWAAGHRHVQLWLYDLDTRTQRLVWTTSGSGSSGFTNLVWAPSGKKLAFFNSTDDVGSDALGVVDIASLTVTQQGAVGGTISSAGSAWAPDEQSIAYLARARVGASSDLVVSSLAGRERAVLARDIYAGQIPWLAWEGARQRILFLADGIGTDRRQTGLYSLPDTGGDPSRLTTRDEKIDDCGAVVNGRIACRRQAPSVWPAPALVSSADGSMHDVAAVNRDLESIDLAPVRELRWRNEHGDENNGYLILPKNHADGARVPLVVMGYGFSGEFITFAGKTTPTYPAQALARDGIAVLLLNYPRVSGWEGPNFELGSRLVGYGPLSSMKTIIGQLDSEGIIDTHRMGMMGHSLAGFWVQFAITQTNLFKAVEINNGGTASEPGTYWSPGSKEVRELQEHIMGGPPYGDTLKNYLGFSMSLNADKIKAAVLMEFDAVEALSAMESFEAMQHYRVPVDLFVYPNDGHVTERPEHRLKSLQRNLDWFEFWLLGRENDASSKPDEYPYWRKLRDLAGEKAVTGAAVPALQ